MSEFGREVIVSHLNNITRNKIASLIFCKMCCNIANKSKFMDNESHKNTWNNFTKFVLWGTVAVIIVLVLMAIFLL